jgi:predicted TIM-barrel fold metal-dependent hydrolase
MVVAGQAAWNLDQAIKLARDFPRTLVILNHAALPADRSPQGLAGWQAAMARFSEEPNVRVKISGIGRRGRPWSVEDSRWIVEEIACLARIVRCSPVIFRSTDCADRSIPSIRDSSG